MHTLRYKVLHSTSGGASVVLMIGGQHHLFMAERAQQLMETLDALAIDFIAAQMEEDARKLSWRGGGPR